MPEIFQSENGASEANRLRMMLRTWEAISTERELPGVLASLADVLVPLVPFDSIGIIDFTVPNDTPDEDGDLHRLLALHIVGVAPLDGETPEQLAARSDRYAQPPPLTETRPLLPYPKQQEPQEVAGEPYTCDDLLEKD